MNTNSANSAYEKNEKTVDKYIKAIKKEFPIYRKGEKRYLKMLRSSMYDYAVSFEGELITVSHLSEKFGSPKDCANTYIEWKEIWKIYFHYRAFCYTGFCNMYISYVV